MGHVLRQSIHKDESKVSSALCVVSHVNTVDTKDQSMSCFNGLNYNEGFSTVSTVSTLPVHFGL